LESRDWEKENEIEDFGFIEDGEERRKLKTFVGSVFYLFLFFCFYFYFFKIKR